MLQHFKGKLQDLCLGIDTTATDVINNFELFVWKLGKVKDTDWSDDKKVQEFKDKVTSEDYDIECHVHTGNFKELTNLI
eukprot:9977180-Ditylum_brightwellii.AAC.1